MTIPVWLAICLVVAVFVACAIGERIYQRSLIDMALHQNRLRQVIHRSPGSRASLAAAVELMAPDARIVRFEDIEPGRVRIDIDGPLWWWERAAVVRAIRAETPCAVTIDFEIKLRRP